MHDIEKLVEWKEKLGRIFKEDDKLSFNDQLIKQCYEKLVNLLIAQYEEMISPDNTDTPSEIKAKITEVSNIETEIC